MRGTATQIVSLSLYELIAEETPCRLVSRNPSVS